MTWKKMEPTFKAGRAKEFISLSKDKFNFSRGFLKKAKIEDSRSVEIYVDMEEKKIGFKFFKEVAPGRLSFAIVRKTLNCSSIGSITQFPWLKEIINKSPNQRRFEPYKEDELWVIDLSEKENEIN